MVATLAHPDLPEPSRSTAIWFQTASCAGDSGSTSFAVASIAYHKKRAMRCSPSW